MTRYMRWLRLILLGAAALGLAAPAWAAPLKFEACRIYIEYNATDTANDLGFHVFFDAEAWKSVDIENPDGDTIFHVKGKGNYIKTSPYGDLGLSELFTEGAEPSLYDFPLDQLLKLFPEGQYKFTGETPDGAPLTICKSNLSHAVPAGPVITSANVNVDGKICWEPVTEVATNPADPSFGGDFPKLPLDVVAYQVIVNELFQVTVPAASPPPEKMCVTVPPEFPVKKGDPFEVLAIDKSGNQTTMEGSIGETN